VRVTIWGCRGSLAAPGPATVRYGGNTSCVEVRTDGGARIVLDAGTGIRSLGAAFGDGDEPVHLLLTHLHLDHIEGLGFFAPIWTPRRRVSVWGPPSPVRTLRDRVARYFSPPFFPIDLNEIPCDLAFADAGPSEWTIGDVRVTPYPVQHPGPTVAYRLEVDGRALAYVPDHEPALGTTLDALGDEWLSGLPVAADADVLLHDGQYTDEEYRSRVGWGHSSVPDAVGFARRARARRLILFHHDPSRSDDELDAFGRWAAELADGAFPTEVAREGMQFDV
jgi:phosphoribosyl 1,2-cyclic phosphodiesterase